MGVLEGAPTTMLLVKIHFFNMEYRSLQMSKYKACSVWDFLPLTVTYHLPSWYLQSGLGPGHGGIRGEKESCTCKVKVSFWGPFWHDYPSSKVDGRLCVISDGQTRKKSAARELAHSWNGATMLPGSSRFMGSHGFRGPKTWFWGTISNKICLVIFGI